MLNTDNAAQLYAQCRLCCSGLCSILTMLLHSMLNTHYAAQPCRNCWYYCELEMWFLIFTGTSWGANNISWFCRLTGTGHRVFFPGSWHGNHVKNSSSTSKYVRKPAAAWILVLLLALQMLQNNSANSVVAEIFQLYLHKACVTKKRTKPYSRTIMIFCMTTAGYSTCAYRFLRKSANNCLYLHKEHC